MTAVVQMVVKKLKAINTSEERLGVRTEEELRRWNNYLVFAFDKKESTAEFYESHKKDIEYVADQCQSGSIKNQLDRQLIWRHKQTPPEIEYTPDPAVADQSFIITNPIWSAYRDIAIRHNTGFMMGTIGRAIATSGGKTDLDVSYFALDAIQVMRSRMESYDPVQTAVSSYMTKPIIW